jgi:hypothetical protein
MVLNFIYVYNIIHHKKKNSTKNSFNNFSFEIYMQNFKLCDEYYFVTNIHYTLSSSIFFNQIFLQTSLSLRLINYTLK